MLYDHLVETIGVLSDSDCKNSTATLNTFIPIYEEDLKGGGGSPIAEQSDSSTLEGGAEWSVCACGAICGICVAFGKGSTSLVGERGTSVMPSSSSTGLWDLPLAFSRTAAVGILELEVGGTGKVLAVSVA